MSHCMPSLMTSSVSCTAQVANFLKKKGHHLKALNFEGNQSRLIPDSFENMRMLVSLNLGGNQLPQVPNGVDSLRILTSLSLEKNKLKTLPDSLGQCTSLTYLDVSHNELNWLPDSLKTLKNLMTLKVLGCYTLHMSVAPFLSGTCGFAFR